MSAGDRRMRAGLSTILQTLNPDAASVLNQSIAEASKRGHGQTTPLHVAATLLAAPAGILRQACVRSHPNTSHPLQCRALELCFSVALDRLPSNSSSDLQPPISNALMTALKRAQANQRRGCPEQQQQPLLAIKVEIEQLVISILDDPNVSRVMREASFSSPAVKSAVEQLISAAPPVSSSPPASNSSNPPILAGIVPRALPPQMPLLVGSKNPYMNPRLAKNAAAQSEEREEVRKAFDVMLRRKKRNPILVGDSDPHSVAKQILQKVERNETGPEFPKRIEVISLEKKLSKLVAGVLQISPIIREIGDSIDRLLGIGAAVILDAGDLQWLVEKSSGGFRAAVISETKNLLSRFFEKGKVWLLASTSSATYLRLQGYHPSVELDWDLQAVLVSSRSPLSSFPSRLTTNGALPRRLPEKSEMCSACKDSYERELAKLVAMECEKSITGSKPDKPLPPWLQCAKLSFDSSSAQSQTRQRELSWKKTTEDLITRWRENCSRLHSNLPPALKPREVATDLMPACKDETVDYDSFKQLLKGLEEKVNWQRKAATAVAGALTRRKHRGATWLLFTGPDLLGKRKMAAAMATLLFNSDPFTVAFGGGARSMDALTFSRGKTAMDRVAQALRRNPFSVIVLEGIDSADALVTENLKRAMERGRMADSHGKEVSLSGSIFVLASSGGPVEEKLIAAANASWQLELTSLEKKRRADQTLPGIPKLPRLSLDLNLAASASDEDSSDITVEHDETSKCNVLLKSVDSAVEFMPVDFEAMRRQVRDSLSRKFRMSAGEGMTLAIDEAVIDKFVGGLWFGSMPVNAFEDWAERVVVPSFRQLKSTGSVVKLVPLMDGGAAGGPTALPSWVRVTQ